MKKTFVTCLFLIVLLILNGCSTTKEKITVDNAKNIEKITIKTLPGNEKSLRSTEDKNKISVIINYINSLDLKRTSKDADQYYGMTYVITVFYKDKSNSEYIHFGNMFFKESGKSWNEIPQVQAEKIEGIYNSLGSKS